jgi:oligopeptide transport system substrate-binding protein
VATWEKSGPPLEGETDMPISTASSFGRQVSVLLVLFALFGASCTRHNGDIDVELPGGKKIKLAVKETLRVPTSSEPPTLDWIKSSDTASAEITANLMEGLTQYDLTDKELGLKPALALKWEASDSGRKWKFTLREGVVWSDGVPFTAQHVADGFKHLLSRETAATYAYSLFGLKNAQAFNQGKVPFEDVGVKVTGANEVTFELDKPMSFFPYLLSHHATYPVRLDVIKKGGDRWTEPETIVTLGPYVLKAWQHDKVVFLERNEKYYDAKPQIKNIIFYMIQETGTQINLFDSGKLDAVHNLPSVELRKLRTRKEHREVMRLGTAYYGFNVTKPPLDKVLVRRAISMAIDRQQIVQMLAGGQVPLTSWIPTGMFGYEAERGLSFNPEKARELLKQAGYDDPLKVPKIEIRFNTNEDHARIAENIQAQLKKNLGIAIELKNEEWKVFLNTLKTDPPQVFRFGWQGDFPDPDNFLNLMVSHSDNNHTKWKNLRFDELVAKGAGTLDREERKKIYSEAQKILVEEDVPVVPLYIGVTHLLISERTENYPVNAMSIFSFKGTRLKQ